MLRDKLASIYVPIVLMLGRLFEFTTAGSVFNDTF